MKNTIKKKNNLVLFKGEEDDISPATQIHRHTADTRTHTHTHRERERERVSEIFYVYRDAAQSISPAYNLFVSYASLSKSQKR